MKKNLFNLLLIACCMLHFSISNAQVPQAFNYQAIVRDASGMQLLQALFPFRWKL